MTYKEKLENKMNIKPFALFRLVKDKYHDGSDEPFYSFYDGDWFCGYDEEGRPLFGGDIDDAEVIDNDEYGNKVLHHLVDLYKEKNLTEILKFCSENDISLYQYIIKLLTIIYII